MQETFTIAQDLSFGEYFRFSLYMVPRTKIVKRLFIYLTILGILSGVFSLYAPGKNETRGLILLQSLMPPVILFLFFFVFLFLAAIYISRFKSHMIRGITYRFTHWGMERTGTETEAMIPWRDFQKLAETKSFFLLYVKEKNISNVHVIQKRMFASDEEAGDFREFVEHRLPSVI